MNFPSQIFFNDINHGYRAAIFKKNSLWLLPFYMVVATYFYYEKVRKTMRTAIVSNLLKTVLTIYNLILQNDCPRSNNLSATANELFECVRWFCGIRSYWVNNNNKLIKIKQYTYKSIISTIKSVGFVGLALKNI